MSNPTSRILIADDENHIRLLLKAVIRLAGLDLVAQATNGQEAVDLYREKRPDLVLLDLNMPSKNGDEALEEILHEFPDARIIMLTSVTDSVTVAHCLKLGAYGYLRKDTHVEQIQEAIRQAALKISGS